MLSWPSASNYFIFLLGSAHCLGSWTQNTKSSSHILMFFMACAAQAMQFPWDKFSSFIYLQLLKVCKWIWDLPGSTIATWSKVLNIVQVFQNHKFIHFKIHHSGTFSKVTHSIKNTSAFSCDEKTKTITSQIVNCKQSLEKQPVKLLTAISIKKSSFNSSMAEITWFCTSRKLSIWGISWVVFKYQTYWEKKGKKLQLWANPPCLSILWSSFARTILHPHFMPTIWFFWVSCIFSSNLYYIIYTQANIQMKHSAGNLYLQKEPA